MSKRKPFSELPPSNQLGRKAEYQMAALLSVYGRDVVRSLRYNSPFDLLVDGWRVDVKASSGHMHYGVPTWTFRTQRHGKVAEDCDFYILRMDNVPYRSRKALYLLVKAPIGTNGISVSFSSLLGTHLKDVLAFREFVAGKYGLKQIAA